MPRSPQSETPPDQEIWNGRIEISRAGLLQSIVQAGHIEWYETDKLTQLDQGVVVDFYNRRGQHASKLISQSARVEEKSDLFMASGDVVVVSDSGATLRTERLFWDRKRQKIRSDTLVILTTQMDSLRGYEFEANEDLSAWRMLKPVGQTFRRVRK